MGANTQVNGFLRSAHRSVEAAVRALAGTDRSAMYVSGSFGSVS